eukprot:GHRR01020641.1.p1 GENE.GHRR01020641.1~~GHRR01020641.1.p1  ORF type:complete len:319 (+),score=199.76 GHRR01020641.1:31-957(+)
MQVDGSEAAAAAAAGGGGGGGSGGNAPARKRGKKQQRTPCKSSLKGVFWDRKTGRWRSQLGYHNRKIFMGYFNTPEEAAIAYDQKAVELHGRLAKTNYSISDYLPDGVGALPSAEDAIPLHKRQQMAAAAAAAAAADEGSIAAGAEAAATAGISGAASAVGPGLPASSNTAHVAMTPGAPASLDYPATQDGGTVQQPQAAANAATPAAMTAGTLGEAASKAVLLKASKQHEELSAAAEDGPEGVVKQDALTAGATAAAATGAAAAAIGQVKVAGRKRLPAGRADDIEGAHLEGIGGPARPKRQAAQTR